MNKKKLRQYATRERVFFKERGVDGHVAFLRELDPASLMALYDPQERQVGWLQWAGDVPWVTLDPDDVLVLRPERQKVRL